MYIQVGNLVYTIKEFYVRSATIDDITNNENIKLKTNSPVFIVRKTSSYYLCYCPSKLIYIKAPNYLIWYVR